MWTGTLEDKTKDRHEGKFKFLSWTMIMKRHH